MKDNLAILVSAIVIFGVVLLAGRKFRISSRYEREPRAGNSWSDLDAGVDPTDEIKWG